ncbi:aminopeptidase [Chloroflexota bacterium]
MLEYRNAGGVIMRMGQRKSPLLASALAQKMVSKFLGLRPAEQVLILADSESDADFVYALASAVIAHQAEPTVVEITATFDEGMDRPLPPIFLEAIKGADVYIPVAATTYCAIHSLEVLEQMRGNLREKNMRMFVPGGRYSAGLYGQTWQYMLEALSHDYEKVAEWCNTFCRLMANRKTISVKSEAGSDFTASIEGDMYRPESGFAREPGELGIVPGGEVWGGPREFTCEGVIAIDGPIAYVAHKPKLSEPVLVTLKKGRVVDIRGGEEAEGLKRWMDRYENADILAEISLGTNPFLQHTGEVNVVDKRILGVIHVAFGENIFQIYPHGSVWSPVHADMVLLEPSCWVDDVQLLDKGVPVVGSA